MADQFLSALDADFADPVLATQAIFRTALAALAEPGTVHAMPVELPEIGALAPATIGLCRTLVDGDTPLWLDAAAASTRTLAYLSFHCGGRRAADPAAAAFAIVSESLACPPLSSFAAGTPDYPDRSTTIFLQVKELDPAGALRLSGPGIDGARAFGAAPLPPGFWQQMQANNAIYPLGVDVYFVAGRHIAALPRSTRLEA